MASFDGERKRSLSESDAYLKFPYKRVEPCVSKFITVLETNIDRLKKHQTKIEKFLGARDWSGLHTEQVNASRTVQQINATVREMEKARNQIRDEDLGKFDSKVMEVKQMAVKAVVDFVDNCGGSDTVTGNTGPAVLHVESSNLSTDSRDGQIDDIQLTSPLQAHMIPDNTEAAESWENLRDNLIELNALFHEFSGIVQDQQEKIDTIEDNINQAHENVQQATITLGKASKLKAAVYPFAGALIGGVVAGPVGVIAGLKIGGLAAVGGGVLGFAGGRYVKGKQDKAQETELKNISKRGSQSEAS